MSEEEAKATTEEPKEEGEGAKNEEEKAPEEESTAVFTPVVELAEQEIESGEEEEEAVYTHRCKLYIFGETLLDQGTGNKTWRERGVGDIRILRHREHQKIRVLMRQDKTMKVICNHVLDPRLELSTNAGSDRSWVYSAFDFSSGELEETVFAVKFGDSDKANTFKEAFEKYQAEMKKTLAGEDNPGADGGKAGDEAAEALAGLSTKADE